VLYNKKLCFVIVRRDGGSVPQSGNAAGRPAECSQDNVTEYRR